MPRVFYLAAATTATTRQKYGEAPVLAVDYDQRANTSLLSLPTELIEMVLDKLDDEGLYSLALLNKRLHFLALPIFISRQPGIFNRGSGMMFLNPSSPNLLRAARVALYIQELNYVSVVFEEPWPILPILKGLERLISRMRHVREVSFRLRPSLRFGFGHAPHLKPLAKGLATLMKTLNGKGCMSVDLRELSLIPQRTAFGSRSEITPLTTLQSFGIYRSNICHPSVQKWAVRSINMSTTGRMLLHHC